jgi:hypothetical protein
LNEPDQYNPFYPGIAHLAMFSGESRKSFSKALLMLLLLVAVLFVGTCLLRIVSSPARPIHAILSSETPGGIPYTDNQKDSVQKGIAGLWYSADTDVGAPYLCTTDKVELKPNGIYWRVRSTSALLPSGDSATYAVASTGYVSPYSHAASSPDSISCQIHYIGISVASGNDTCYVEIQRPDPSASIFPQLQVQPKPGEGAVDTVWSIFSGGRHLWLGNHRYSRIDTSGARMEGFFAKGSTEIINKFSLGKCSGELPLELFIKRALTRDFGKLSVAARTDDGIRTTVEKYYKELFAQNLARRVTVFRKGSAVVVFSVNAAGTVNGTAHVASRPWNIKLDKELAQEVQSWVFPRCSSQREPVQARFEVSY